MSNEFSGPGRYVQVVPLGRVDEIAVSVVAANIQAFTGLPADKAAPWPRPEYALIQARQQYDAAPILAALAEDLPSRALRIGLLSEDLCLRMLKHVYGEARVNGRTAVVSLFRLGRGPGRKPVEQSLMYERLAKVAVHETGHALGLRHCRSTDCLMSFTLGLEQIDQLEQRFCVECAAAIRAAVD